MIHVIQFSGGKDSTALVLWAREHLEGGCSIIDPRPNVRYVFCDTGWEHEITYQYIGMIDSGVLGGRLIRLRSERYPGGMKQLVSEKGRIPSRRGRFCTDELKIQVTAAYLKTLDDEYTVYQGVRGDESDARMEAGSRLWSNDYDCWVERPLYRWTVEDVFRSHQNHGIDPNPLYKLGASRVGCFPCVMANHGEMKRVGETLPEVWDRVLELESAAGDGRTFFPPDYIPARFCAKQSEKGNGLPTVHEVKLYLRSADEHQIRLFDARTPSGCMSIYNQCE